MQLQLRGGYARSDGRGCRWQQPFHFILVRVTGVRDEKAVFPTFVNVAALAFGRVQFQPPERGSSGLWPHSFAVGERRETGRQKVIRGYVRWMAGK